MPKPDTQEQLNIAKQKVKQDRQKLQAISIIKKLSPYKKFANCQEILNELMTHIENTTQNKEMSEKRMEAIQNIFAIELLLQKNPPTKKTEHRAHARIRQIIYKQTDLLNIAHGSAENLEAINKKLLLEKEKLQSKSLIKNQVLEASPQMNKSHVTQEVNEDSADENTDLQAQIDAMPDADAELMKAIYALPDEDGIEPSSAKEELHESTNASLKFYSYTDLSPNNSLLSKENESQLKQLMKDTQNVLKNIKSQDSVISEHLNIQSPKTKPSFFTKILTAVKNFFDRFGSKKNRNIINDPSDSVVATSISETTSNESLQEQKKVISNITTTSPVDNQLISAVISSPQIESKPLQTVNSELSSITIKPEPQSSQTSSQQPSNIKPHELARQAVGEIIKNLFSITKELNHLQKKLSSGRLDMQTLEQIQLQMNKCLSDMNSYIDAYLTIRPLDDNLLAIKNTLLLSPPTNTEELLKLKTDLHLHFHNELKVLSSPRADKISLTEISPEQMPKILSHDSPAMIAPTVSIAEQPRPTSGLYDDALNSTYFVPTGMFSSAQEQEKLSDKCNSSAYNTEIEENLRQDHPNPK